MYNLPILAKSLQLHNSPVDYTRVLIKPSKDSTSLLVCNEKSLGFGQFHEKRTPGLKKIKPKKLKQTKC